MAQDPIEIEYNEDLLALEELLKDVERTGEFFVTGTTEVPMPKVDVEGVGVLSFPVPPAQIQSLIQQATRAPYGRGEETILDESVRKVWQLSPNTVRISGKSWPANFDALLNQVAVGLGCERTAIAAEFYKMLVYDVDGFFLAHRDTEKTNGMFGTLVVVLPSTHRGGDLILRHAGREVTIDLSGGEVSELKFAAFYADCEHEVKPITEGNRVCLIFNLVQKQGSAAKRTLLQAPNYEKEIATAAELLRGHLTEPDAPAKIAWLLEHQYSPDGLSFANLKAADAAQVKVLEEAAERAGCAVHLGIVHIEESGGAQSNYDGYQSRRWGRDYGRDESKSAASESFEIIEVSDCQHYISQWRDRNDQPVEFGQVPIEPGELLPNGALDGEKPDVQRLMEASGNEGASFERSYHRAALVLWRRDRYAEVLLQAGVAATLPYLQEKVTTATLKAAPLAARKEAIALARLVVNNWKTAPQADLYRPEPTAEQRGFMLRILNALGEVSLLEQFIAEVVIPSYDGTDNTTLAATASILGPEKSAPLFAELVRQHTQFFHAHCVSLLGSLNSKVGKKANSNWHNALCHVAETITTTLDQVGSNSRESEWMLWRLKEKASPLDAKLVAEFLNLLGDLNASALRTSAVEQFAARPLVFDPVKILVPALDSLHAWDAAACRLWHHSAEFLLQRSALPPEAPKDWRQDVKLSCKCEDCRELQTFILDPIEQTHRFRVRQSRRSHLESAIRNHSLDISYATDTKGSPQTLVCTKDRRSFQRRCQQYRDDIAALASLAKFIDQAGAASPLDDRIKAARALADAWSSA